MHAILCALVASVLCAPQEAAASKAVDSQEALPAERLDRIRLLVRNGMDANISLIDTVNATIVRRERATPKDDDAVAKDLLIETVRTYDVRAKQEVVRSATRTSRNGRLLGHTETLFDGVQTLVFNPMRWTAEIVAGRVDSPPGRAMIFDYRAFAGSVDGFLDLMTDARLERYNGNLGIRLIYASTEGIVEYLVRPERGFLLEHARATDTQGRLCGERTNVHMEQSACGAWHILQVTDEVFAYQPSGLRSVAESNVVSATIHSVNHPLAGSLLDLRLPPATAVSDQVYGDTYVTPGTRPMLPANVDGPNSDSLEYLSVAFGVGITILVARAVSRRYLRRKS